MAFIDARYKDFKITTTAGSAPNTTINYTNLADKKVENAPSQIHLIGINYDLKGLSLTLQTKITSSVFSDANNTESPNSAATIGKINGYNLWDFSIKYRLNKRFDFQFNLNNIGNIKYATRRAGGYPGPGLIPGEGRTFNFGFGVEI
jgi:Fe(3+) dicitrate transport protein